MSLLQCSPQTLLFHQIDPRKSAALPVRLVNSGQHLFREGDRVDRIYRVLSGTLRLTRLMEDGRRQIIAFGLPGDVIGFPRDNWHQTDCEALTKTELQPFSALRSRKRSRRSGASPCPSQVRP